MEQKYNSYNEYKKYFRILPVLVLALFLSDALFFSALFIMLQNKGIAGIIYLTICALIFVPIFLKFVKTMQFIMKGVKRKYVCQSLYSFGIYWAVIAITILFSGKINGGYLFFYTWVVTGEGIVLAVIRGRYFLKTMKIFYPSILEKNIFTNNVEQERYEQRLSEELEKIYFSTCFSEVVKAIDLRHASSAVVLHIFVPFFTVESLLMLGVVA